MKRIKLKTFASLSIIVILLMPMIMQAAILNESNPFQILSKYGSSGRLPTAVKWIDNDYAYCLESSKLTPPSGSDLKPMTSNGDYVYENDTIWNIVKHGYPNKKWFDTGDKTLDEKLNYYITQMAVWAEKNSWSDATIQSFKPATGSSKWPIISAVNHDYIKQSIIGLRRDAKADTNQQLPSIDLYKPMQEAKKSGNKFISPHFLPIVNNVVGTITITMQNAPAGTRILDADTNQPINGNTVPTGKKFYFEIPGTVTQGEFGFLMNCKGNTVRAVRYNGGSSAYQDLIRNELVKIEIGGKSRGIVKWKEDQEPPEPPKPPVSVPGSLIIIKKDYYSKGPLENAQFRITGPNGFNVVRTTGKDGKIVIKDLPAGTYIIKEIKAPDGYNINKDDFPAVIVEVKGDGENPPPPPPPVIVEVIDHPADGSIEAIKRNPNDDRLQGVTFKLTGPDGFSSTKKTDINGIVRWDKLKFGEYTLEELDTLPGYILNKGPWKFTVGPDKTEHWFQKEIINYPKDGTIQLKKIDMETKVGLAGARFIISGPQGFNEEMVSDAQGLVTISNPKPGEYTVKELVAPEGYIMNTKPWYFTVKPGETGGRIIELENKKIKAPIKIRKVDDAEGEPLKGAEFKITSSNGYNETHTSGDDGWIVLKDMEYGKYVIEEIKAPDGYMLNKKPIEFKLDKPDKAYEFIVKNTKKRAQIEIEKVDKDTGKPIEKVKFEIKGPNGYNQMFLTDKEGKLLADYLEMGTYKIKELLAAEGYISNEDEITIEVKDSEKYDKLITNEKIKGKVKVTKKGSDGKLLEGAKFELQSLDDKDLRLVATSDKNGIALFDKVRYGDYELREIEPPEGYALNPKVEMVTIAEQDKLYEFEYVNRLKVAQLIIRKVDSVTKEVLEGAKFKIEKDGKPYKEVVTNEVGNATLKDVPMGTYVITEIEAPQGYLINKDKHTIIIDKENKIYEVVVEDQPKAGRIQVIKKDKSSGKSLAGVEFTIFDDWVYEVDTIVTDEHGEGLSKVLSYGKYTMKETRPLPGYKANDRVYNIVIGDGKDFVKYEITNEKGKGKLELTKTDISTGETIPQAKFKIYAEDKSTVVTQGITDSKGKAVFDLDIGKYFYQEYEAPDGYLLDNSLYGFEIKKDGEIVKAEMTNKKLQINVEIVKTGDKISKGLEGAVFQIHKDGKPIEFIVTTKDGTEKTTNLVSDKNGRIKVPQALGIGEYTIVETKAPIGFELGEPIQFSVTKDLVESNKKVLEFKVKNKEVVGDVELLKTIKGTSNPLEGVKFRLVQTKNILGEKINKSLGDYKTNSEGKIVIKDLLYGEYYLEEIETVKGYVLDKTKMPFKIQEQGHLIKLSMGNKNIEGNVKLLKIDEETRKGLGDVTFELYNEKDKVGVYRTNSSGTLIIKNLKYGKYKLKETQPAKGYKGAGQEVEFYIQEDNHTVELTMTNKKSRGKLEITKTDISTGELLPNAGFKIYGEDKKSVVVQGKTDKAGKAVFILETGKYYYQEFEAPEGYVVNAALFPFEIKDDGEIVKCKMTNKPIKGCLEIIKKDSKTGELLGNAKFEILSDDKKKVVASGITNAEGSVKFNLQYGKYYYKEIEAPKGYILNNTPVSFSITENGKTIKRTVENKPVLGNLIVIKTDLVDKTKRLQGAVFEVYDKKDNIIIKGPTNKDGEFIVKGLPIGEYYIKEEKAPCGYIKSNELYKFEIKENKETKEITVTNEAERIAIPKTGTHNAKLLVPAILAVCSIIWLISKRRG